MNSSSTTAYIDRKRLKTTRNPNTNLRSSRAINDDGLDQLLDHCFRRMLPHIWYKVLPSSSCDVDNIAFLMGQNWELILKLLIQLKYIKPYKTDYRINLDKFREVGSRNINDVKLHFGSAHKIGHKLVYYICKNEPLHHSPTIQNKHAHCYSKLRYFDVNDSILKKCLNRKLDVNDDTMNCLRSLHRGGNKCSDNENEIATLSEHVNPAPATTTVTENTHSTPNPPNNPIYTDPIENEISSALALDLTIVPRYNQIMQTEKIFVRKVKQANATEKLIVLLTAERWGYKSSTKTYDERHGA